MVWVEIWIFPVKLRLGKEFATTSLHMTNRELHYVSFNIAERLVKKMKFVAVGGQQQHR
jgi:hypothetical protein